MESQLGLGKTVFSLLLVILLLFVTQGIASLIYTFSLPTIISSFVYTIMYVFLTFWGIKQIVKKLLKFSLRECRIIKLHLSKEWLICAFILPVYVITIFLLTPGEFIQNEFNGSQAIGIIITAIFVTGLGAGIVEEMVFRGVIMTVLEKQWGRGIAILVPSFIFGMLHAIGKDLRVIDFLLLLIGGTCVGIMFSLIVIKSGSIWNSVLVHAIWNITIIGNVLHIGAFHNQNSMYSYKLYSDSLLLTGGRFGIEVSSVAILGYASVIIYTFLTMKRNKKLEERNHIS